MQVNIPGPFGVNGIEVLESLPNLSELNGVEAAKVLERGESVVEGKLVHRLPVWSNKEPVVERILRAMWSYVMTYRLCDEERLDETPIWYLIHIIKNNWS
jgi:tubulin--tyrosine ligase-like protein 12